MNTLTNLWQAVAAYWAANQAPIILGTGTALLTLLAVLVWRFVRTRERSKVVSTLAALVVMAWTSEGLLHVGLTKFQLPPAFAAMTFFVFEAMMVASALKAEEHRKAKGVPGPAGRYVFVLAIASGVVSAFGAHNLGEIVLRVVLPTLAVGLWWIFLTAERDDDQPQWKAAREARTAARRASWAITPNTILVRVGLKNAGEVTVTEAQRQYLIRRMVTTAETMNTASLRWVGDRSRRRLRRLARRADAGVVDAVVVQVDIAASVADRLDRRPPVPAPQHPGDRNRDQNPAEGADTPNRNPDRHPTGTAPSTPAAPVPAPLAVRFRNPADTGTGTPVNGSSTPTGGTPTKGVDTPRRNPANDPASTPEPQGSTTPPEPPVTSVGTPDGTGSDTPEEFPADAVLLAVLRDPGRVSREPDGTVPVKRAMKVLGAGRPRVLRLLRSEGLLRETPTDGGSDTPDGTGAANGSDDDPERVPEPRINGHHHDLIGATA